jgi:hypothetical protein
VRAEATSLSPDARTASDSTRPSPRLLPVINQTFSMKSSSIITFDRLLLPHHESPANAQPVDFLETNIFFNLFGI